MTSCYGLATEATVKLDIVLPLTLGVVIGACATAAVKTADPAAGEAAAAAAATVVALDAAPTAVAPSGKATIQHLARGNNAYVGKLTMAGGGKVPLHRDATEEYIHVLAGSGTLSIDGVEHALAAGVTVYMPAIGEVTYSNGPDELQALQVFAGPAPAAKYDGWSKK